MRKEGCHDDHEEKPDEEEKIEILLAPNVWDEANIKGENRKIPVTWKYYYVHICRKDVAQGRGPTLNE